MKTDLETKLIQYQLSKIPEEFRDSFFQKGIAHLKNPFLLPDLEEALIFLKKSFQEGKHILLFGDRDTDGVSSTSLLGLYFQKLQLQFPFQLSIKLSSEGDDYGLCPSAVASILEIRPDVLITLDFGSTNSEQISQLKQSGIDTIVLDHHELPEKTPNCFFINPKRVDSQYPEKKICTSVLSFKLVHAFLYSFTENYNKIFHLDEDLFHTNLYVNGKFLEKGEKNFLKQKYPQNWYPFPISPEKGKEAENLFSHQTETFENLDELLFNSDLASIGTVSDMMPLHGENRILVKLGLEFLSQVSEGKKNARPGIAEILKLLELRPGKILSKEMGWSLGPLLNSAGRMGKTELALDLLMSGDTETAKSKAKEINGLNGERRLRLSRNLERLNQYFLTNPEKKQSPVAFCYTEEMEMGVSGIVATKMTEEFKKTAIFISPDVTNAKGSIRAFGKENVLDILKTASDLLIQFGGHPEAGGFSIAKENIQRLEERIGNLDKTWIAEVQQKGNKENVLSLSSSFPNSNPTELSGSSSNLGFGFPSNSRSNSKSNGNMSSSTELIADLENIQPFSVEKLDLNSKLYKTIESFEPFGMGNDPVKLLLDEVEPIGINMLGNGKHLKFSVVGVDKKIKFMVWNKSSEFFEELEKTNKLRIVGTLEENYYKGYVNLQFVVSEFFSI